MALLSERREVQPQASERRWFQRVRVKLFGRFILPDRREYPLEVLDISPGGVAVVAPVSGKVGERVVAYVDQIGRIEGTIMRTHPTGFALAFAATAHKRDRLADQLTWLANRYLLNLPQERECERVVPHKPHARLILPDATTLTCEILQLSQSGAAVLSESKPPINALVRLGKAEGRVVRVSEEGFAVEFTTVLPADSFEAAVTGD